MRFASLAALGLGCLVASPAQGDYFPLDEGVLRRYEVVVQGQVHNDSRYFHGTAEFNGTTTHTLHYAGGPDDGLQQYWSQEAGGDVSFHGFDRPGLSAHYSPALVWLDVPLFVGKTWDTTAHTPFELHLHFEVVAEEAITVPAGTFQCFTIEWSTPLAPAAKLGAGDVLGRRSGVSGDPTGTLESVADGTGLVQSSLGLARTDRLLSIDPDFIGVQLATWSSIRLLYR